MRSLYYLLIASTLLLGMPLPAQLEKDETSDTIVQHENEKIIDTLGKVNLIAVPKENKDGSRFGTDYYIYNGHEIPVQVKITLVDPLNIKEGMLTNFVTVKGGERFFYGWVIQVDEKSPAKWNVKWEVSGVPAEETMNLKQ